MEVKAKASIVENYDSYDYKYYYSIKYTYKTKGFKRKTNHIRIIWQRHNESTYEYDRRIIKELSVFSVEDVIDMVKEDIVKDLSYRIITNTNEEEKARLLKELKNIEFEFKVKPRL